MGSEQQIDPQRALNVAPPTSWTEFTIALPDHICIADVIHGGFMIGLLQQYAMLYGAGHPKLKRPLDVRASFTNFHRPVFPAKGPVTIRLREVSISNAWSTLHFDVFQGDLTKVCITTDFSLINASIPGVTLKTKWELSPPPAPVDLAKLETYEHPNWVCYHPAFYPQGFRRAQAYVKFFIPIDWSPSLSYIEQWIAPGWDCAPKGSANSSPARWTNELIPFATDSMLPVQENYFPQVAGRPLPIGSMAANFKFAAAQKKARDEGRANWRELDEDGSAPDGVKVFLRAKNMMQATIFLQLEIKKKLPPEGVRWLYIRVETKKIENGRQDIQLLCFDEHMELIAIRTGVEQIVPPASKERKRSSL